MVVTYLGGGCTFLVCSFIPDKGIVTLAIKILICIVIPNGVFLISYIKYPLFKESKI